MKLNGGRTMTESLKKYVLLGFLLCCLGLVLYAMPAERPILNEGMITGVQISRNKSQPELTNKKQSPFHRFAFRNINNLSL